MKKVTCGCMILLVLAATINAITTAGNINTNETWSGLVVLTGDVTMTGGVLTIKPGTTIKLPNNATIWAKGGGIQAIGTEA